MDEARWEPLEARLRELEARVTRLEASSDAQAPLAAAQAVPDAIGAPPAPPVAATSAPPPPPVWMPVAPAAQPGPWLAVSNRARPTPSAKPVVASVPVASTWGQASATPSAPKALPSLRELEERFAGRALAWVGGLALVAAAIFFLSLAFSRGWINEPLRVLIGLAAGCAALVGGGLFLDHRNRLMGNVLCAVGLGVISVSLFAATRLYGLIPPELGLLAALVTVMAAAALAIRFDTREVAAFGLVAALAAPILVGASPTSLTLAFLAITLIGTTAIAIFRSWGWLPVIAFVLTAPQLASWLVSGAGAVEGLVVLAGFWLVTAIAAAGEELRIRRDDLRPTSAVLVVANAAFLVWGGFVLLTGDLASLRGAFVASAAIAHLALGGWFLRRQGLNHLYGNLVAATGIALVTLAAFVQLGAAVVPVAWAAEGVALTWLAVRRRHRWSAAGALILGGLVGMHLLVVEFPLAAEGSLASTPGSGSAAPFAVVTLAAVLVAGAAAAALVPSRPIRSTLAGVGILLVAWAIPFELGGAIMVAAWVLLLPVSVIIDDGLERLPDDPAIARLTNIRLPIQPASVAGIIGWSAAAVYALGGPLALASWGSVALPAAPFRDEPTLIAALLVVAALAAARWTLVPAFRRVAIGAAVVAAAILIPFEVDAAGVAVGWVGLAAVAILVARRDAGAVLPFTWLAVVLMGAAVVVAVGLVAPPSALVVTEIGAPLVPGWPLAFAAIALGLFAAPPHRQLAAWTTWLQLGAGIAVVYGISIAVAGVFQGMVGGSTATEELAKQAQVALSVCWAALGVVALIVGTARRRPMVREAGLVLIGLATVKVFVIDLASMDVAYRVLVLAGVGILVLLSAWLFTRFPAPRDAPAGAPPLSPGP